MVLPYPEDLENLTVTLQTNERGKNILPSFIFFDKNSRTYTFKPLSKNNLGNYYVEIMLTDSLG
jgi:hypothetical protein